MDQIAKSMAQFTVWTLIVVGSLCMLLSPIARYTTGKEMYMWAFLGASFVALIVALAINRLLRTNA
jgi:hypothetical protein